jgi:hypothetical protein
MIRLSFLAAAALSLIACQTLPDEPSQGGGGSRPGNNGGGGGDRGLVEIFATQEGISGTNVSLYAKGESGDNVNWIANPNAVPIDTDSDGRGEIGGWSQFEVACGEEITLQCNFRDQSGRERWCFENDPDDGQTNQFLGDTVWVDGVASRLGLEPNEWTGANGSNGYNGTVTRDCE